MDKFFESMGVIFCGVVISTVVMYLTGALTVTIY